MTFGLLAGMGFSLYGIKSAILAYQQSKLESLESLRRVRVFDPGDLEGGAIRLDVADVEKFAAEHGVKITESVPVHDLGGEALIPSEMAHLASEGQWAPVQSSALLDPSSIDDRERNANRIFFTILGTFPNEPQARTRACRPSRAGSLQGRYCTGRLDSAERVGMALRQFRGASRAGRFGRRHVHGHRPHGTHPGSPG